MKATGGSAASKSHRSSPQVKGVINSEAEGDPRVQPKHPGPTKPDVGNIIIFMLTRQQTSQMLSFNFLVSVLHTA